MCNFLNVLKSVNFILFLVTFTINYLFTTDNLTIRESQMLLKEYRTLKKKINLYCFVYFFLDDHSTLPVGVTESSNWCGYSTSYSPNAVPLGGYAAYPEATGPTASAMDASSASEFLSRCLLLSWTRFLGS